MYHQIAKNVVVLPREFSSHEQDYDVMDNIEQLYLKVK